MDVINEFQKAIDVEVRGFSFYNYAADLVRDSKGKAALRRLAKDELDHIRALISLSEHLSVEGEWLSCDEALRRGREIEGKKLPIFPSVEEVRGWLSEDPSDTEVLRFGLDIERKAVDYYSKALDGAESQEAKAFFSSMVRIEEGHKRLLEWEYDSLVNSGFWCDHQEFTVEGER